MTDLTDRFALCLLATLPWEGPYEDDPDDPGGATNWGLTFKEWCAWHHESVPQRGTQAWDALIEAFKKMDDETRASIYYHNYWVPLRCAELPVGIDRIVWDAGVNNGVGKSAEWLQKATGAKVDRHIGVVTMAAVRAANPVNLINELCAIRAAYYKSRPDAWKSRDAALKFLKGWLNRNEAMKKLALEDVHGGGNSMGMALGLASIANDAAIAPKATPKAVPATPATTPAQSSTVWASGAGVIGSIVALVQSVNALMGALVQSGQSAGSLHIAAGSAPLEFAVVCLVLVSIASFAYIARERIRKMVQ